MTIIGVAILCGLGTWQLQRMAWKNGIIAQLDAAYGETTEDVASFSWAWSPDNASFAFEKAGGVFRPDKAILLGPKTKDGKVGHHLIVPLAYRGKTLFVDMGWTDVTEISDLPIHSARKKRVEFTGLLRQPDWNNFTPENSPENDVWTKLDLEGIAKAKDLPPPLPVMMYAETASYKFDAAFPNNERWYPRNKHLQYALFWYALAAALLAVFVIYARGKKA